MAKSDAELLTEIVAAFSTVIAETTRAIARQAGGTNRHLIAIDLQKSADKLPSSLGTAKAILGNIAAALDDKVVTPIIFPADQGANK